MKRIRPTAVTVDLGAFAHNLRVVRELAPGQAVCAVVKADAYGHGLVPAGQALEQAGVDWLAVALVEEGVALREAGVKTPVLVMGAALSGGYAEMIEHGLVPVLSRPDELAAYAHAARGARVPFHLKVDTGMARLGLTLAELPSFLELVAQSQNLVVDGLLTHFANADLDDHATNARQLEGFHAALRLLEQRGITPRYCHVANSGGVLTSPEARVGLVRPGLLVYGLSPLVHPAQSKLRPAMRWTTRAVHLKTVPAGTAVSYGGRFVTTHESRIATLPVGYADGYPRSMSGKAEVLVCGKRVPVVGSICMDLCMLDVTHVPEMTFADEVVLLGTQGAESITAYDLARWAGTISWEIVCGVGPRVPRVYVGAA